jgi:glycogen synthase
MNIWLMPSAFHPHRGGVEEVTLQLGRFLKGRGHGVLVLTNRYPPDLPEGDTVDGLEVARFAFPAPGMSLASATRFASGFPRSLGAMLARSPRPDIVHVHCASSQLGFAAAFARLARARLVLTTHGEVDVDADCLFQESIYARTSLRLAAIAADGITACSSWTARSAARIAPILGEAVVIPNGVDPLQWEMTLPPDEPVVATWGRHVPQKGFDLLLDAWPLVRKILPSAVLLIGGEGAQSASLKARATDGVEFLGQVDRTGVAEMLRRTRIVVVPSRVEPFGIVALEAMAAGRAVVWSIHGGLNEATGGLGWSVDPQDRRALARTLVDALKATPDPRELRRHAEGLSWENQGTRYLDLYEQTLRRRRRSRVLDKAEGGEVQRGTTR